MWNSAAVIGRQLRQKDRAAGPILPPQGQKGRPRTPSHASGRPYSPALTTSTVGTGTYGTAGTTGGDNQIPQTSYQDTRNYNSINFNQQPQQKKRNKEDEPQLRCTWHCFCIALKALSGGLFLLVVGTIMSVVGFMAEHNLMSEAHWSEASLTPDMKASLTTYRNLTYAGPVIMGLGGIMVVAALVLTFEVRDTLGIKVVPTKEPASKTDSVLSPVPVIAGKVNSVKRKSITSISSTVGSTGPLLSSTRKLGTEMLLPLTQLNVPRSTPLLSSTGMIMSTSFDRSRLQETIQETAQSESAEAESSVESRLSSNHTVEGVDQGTNARGEVGSSPLRDPLETFDAGINSGTLTSLMASSSPPIGRPPQVSALSRKNTSRHSNSCTIFTTSSSSMKSYDSSLPHDRQLLFDADGGHGLFGLQSPPDPELSDPEGCSLASGDRWKSARCSCSGSPTLSSPAMDLFFPSVSRENRDIIVVVDSDQDDDDDDPSLKEKLFEQQRLQQKLLQQQQLLLQQQQQQLALQQRLLMEQRAKQVQHVRRPKTIASIESDGLSTTSVSSGATGDDNPRHNKYFTPSQSHSSSFSCKQNPHLQQQTRPASTSAAKFNYRNQQQQDPPISSSMLSNHVSRSDIETRRGNSVNRSTSANRSSSSKRHGRTHVASVKVHRESRDSPVREGSTADSLVTSRRGQRQSFNQKHSNNTGSCQLSNHIETGRH